MELSKGIFIIGMGLVDKKHKVVLVADLHIGFEEYLNQQGVLVPRMQSRDMEEKVEKIIAQEKPDTFVIAGDLKHEFGEISNQEWRDTLKMIDLITSKVKKLFIVKGNHDNIIGPIAKKRGVEVVDKFVFGDTIVLHGDKMPGRMSPRIKRIIIGHEHPALTLREGGRREKFKCFLKGKYKRKELIVLPALSPLMKGSNILSDNRISPFLEGDIGKFEVYVAGDKTYRFGKVKELRKQFG